MTREEHFKFLSADGRTMIHAVKWVPEDGKYQAVIQIVHGMVEHIGRYRPFAEYLNSLGFLVVGHDHIGHGLSVTSEAEWGFFAAIKHPSDVLVADMHTLRKKILKENKSLPYFMLGHSMGSYMLRKYLCYHSLDVAGAVIVGTGFEKPFMMRLGMTICKVMAIFRGWHYRSRFVQSLSYNKHYRRFDLYGENLENSWLSKNVENVKEYRSDPRCSFLFTLNGYYGLMEAVRFDCQKQNIRRTLNKMPILLVSGADDPVGACGAGVKKVFRMYRAAGFFDVTCRLYENDRHELLNETDRAKVYRDIGWWLETRMPEEF